MRRKGVLLVAVVLLIAAALAQAETSSPANNSGGTKELVATGDFTDTKDLAVPKDLAATSDFEDKKDLGVTLDVTYVSRYIWRGFDTYKDNHSAIQPSIDLDLYGTGFGLNIWHSRSNGGGAYEDAKEVDYTVYYGNSLFESETYATNYKIGWVYYSYPETPRKGNDAGVGADSQEGFGTFSWPNICPLGIVPSYTYVHMWQSEGGASGFRNCGGPAHVFGLGYDLAVAGFTPGVAEQILHLSADMVYNDGLGASTVDHDWSHAVFGISTGFDLAKNLTFTPGIYYQSSWEDSVNTSDEYWTSLGMKYIF